jgi:hypothetical protein
MILDQDMINSILSLTIGVFGWVIKAVWDAQKTRDQFEREMVEKIQSIEVLIAGDYVKKDEFRILSDAIFRKLDKIEEKIDGKVDKH